MASSSLGGINFNQEDGCDSPITIDSSVETPRNNKKRKQRPEPTALTPEVYTAKDLMYDAMHKKVCREEIASLRSKLVEWQKELEHPDVSDSVSALLKDSIEEIEGQLTVARAHLSQLK
jgi:hypothetical protein